MWPVIPVRTMMCPVCFERRSGSVALMKLTWLKNITSNWSRTRFWVAGQVESSSTVPTTAIITSVTVILIKGSGTHTFRSTTEQDVNAAKHRNSLRNSSPTLPHYPTITSYPTYPILPPLSILPPTLTLIYQVLELGASFLVFNFVWWEASCYVIAMREQYFN